MPGRDGDQHPEPQLRVELAPRSILRGSGSRRRHGLPLARSPRNATVTRVGLPRCAPDAARPPIAHPRPPLGGTGPPDRARRAGLRRPAPRRARPSGWAVRRLFDRVGLVQIDSVNVLAARPLPAAVQPRRAVRHAAARPRRPRRAAAAVRVLGARGIAAAGRAAAAAALAHGRAPPTRRGAACGGSSASGPSSWREVLEEVRARGPVAASEVLAARAPGAHRAVVGLERRQARVRVAVLERPAHLRAAARLRAPLRPARARAAGRRHRARRRRRSRTRSASSCASPRGRSASPPSATCATTSGSTWPTRGRRVAELVEAGELLPGRGRGLARARLPGSRRAAPAARSRRAP